MIYSDLPWVRSEKTGRIWGSTSSEQDAADGIFPRLPQPSPMLYSRVILYISLSYNIYLVRQTCGHMTKDHMQKRFSVGVFWGLLRCGFSWDLQFWGLELRPIGISVMVIVSETARLFFPRHTGSATGRGVSFFSLTTSKF